MNWYKKMILSHYSEPEQLGEGRGGIAQFDERRLDDWTNEHREEVSKMKDIIRRQDWTGFAMYEDAI